MNTPPTITVTRLQLVELLDGHLPRMAFLQYGQFYNDDPAFDVLEYYERVVNAIFDAVQPPDPGVDSWHIEPDMSVSVPLNYMEEE